MSSFGFALYRHRSAHRHPDICPHLAKHVKSCWPHCLDGALFAILHNCSFCCLACKCFFFFSLLYNANLVLHTCNAFVKCFRDIVRLSVKVIWPGHSLAFTHAALHMHSLLLKCYRKLSPSIWDAHARYCFVNFTFSNLDRYDKVNKKSWKLACSKLFVWCMFVCCVHWYSQIAVKPGALNPFTTACIALPGRLYCMFFP